MALALLVFLVCFFCPSLSFVVRGGSGRPCRHPSFLRVAITAASSSPLLSDADAKDVLLTRPVTDHHDVNDRNTKNLEVIALSLLQPTLGKYTVDTSVYMPSGSKVSSSSFMFTDPNSASQQFRWTFQELTGLDWDQRQTSTSREQGKYRYHAPQKGLTAAAFAGYVANPSIRIDLQQVLPLDGPLEAVDPEAKHFALNSSTIVEVGDAPASALLRLEGDIAKIGKIEDDDDNGNVAKYYFVQLVQDDSDKQNMKYGVITRWGTEAHPGFMQELVFEDKALAERRFLQKFREKTGRNWADRQDPSISQRTDKYAIVESPPNDLTAAVFRGYVANPSIRTDLQQELPLNQPLTRMDPEARILSSNSSIAEIDGAPASALLRSGMKSSQGGEDVNPVTKFYFIQMVRDGSCSNSSKFAIITRWGTDGFPGYMQELLFEDKAAAQKRFLKKFREKTGRAWDDREDTSVAGRYAIVHSASPINTTSPFSEQEDTKSTDSRDEDEEPSVSKANENHPLDSAIALRLSSLEEYEVVFDESENLWYDRVLNQCNIDANSNKYIRLQVVRDALENAYFWQRWGRVGEAPNRGSSKLVGPISLAEAKRLYQSKYRTKTRPSSRGGKYEPVEIDGSAQLAAAQESVQTATINQEHCTLHPLTQQLMEVIFSTETRNEILLSFGIDLKRLPLGIPSKSQINAGLKVLDTIDRKLKNDASVIDSFQKLSSMFYTAIPHSFARNVLPPVIDSPRCLQDCYDKCDVLLEMLSTTESLREQEKKEAVQTVPHPADVWYNSLRADLTLLRPDSKDYDMIATYFNETKSRGTLLDIWKIDRYGESNRHLAEFADLDNRRLLWHGTNIGVVAPILTNGLRIMPHSGGRVGSGIYMASLCEKSQQYTPVYSGTEFSCMMLCEAALGTTHNITTDANSLRTAPDGCDSVLAVGEIAPECWHTLDIDGRPVLVPQSGGVSSGVDSRFVHDEFLVYNESQLRLRYIISVKW